MVEARTARNKVEDGMPVGEGLEALMGSEITNAAVLSHPTDRDQKAPETGPAAHQSLAANDDFVALDAHLKLLKQQGSRQPERRALASTVIIAFAVAVLLTPGSRLGLSWPAIAAVAFLFAVMFFFIIATALRQRTDQITLTTLLRTTSRMVQPETFERQPFAQFSEDVRDDLAALDKVAKSARSELHKIIDDMRLKLVLYEGSLLSVNKKSDQLLDNLSIERATIVTNSENLRLALLKVSAETSAELALIAGNLQTLFQAKCEGLIDVIDERNRNFIQQYLDCEERSCAAFKKLLDQAILRAADQSEVNNDRFLSAMARRHEDFEQRFDHHMRQAFVKSDHQIASLLVKTEQSAASAFARVNDLFDRAEFATEQKSKTLHTALANTVIDLSQAFKQNTTYLQETIDTSLTEVGKLAVQCKEAGDDLGIQVVDFKNSVVEPLKHLTQAFGEKSRLIANDVVVEVTSFNEMIARSASQFAAQCEQEKQRFQVNSDESIKQIKISTDRLLAECLASRQRYTELPPKPAFAAESVLVQSQDDFATEKTDAGDKHVAVIVNEPMVVPSFAERYRSRGKTQSWISELLARTDAAASFDKVPAPSHRSIEVVQELLIEVDQIIATDKALYAWSIFKENNVASFDDVFTQQGRRAIESLKQQIDTDENLSIYIEEYLKKVEKLVKEAYAEADDDALLSYMISPNGKTYTLLAYVIERI